MLNVELYTVRLNFFGARNGLWDLPEYSIKQMLLNNCIFVTALFRRTDWETVHGYDSNMKYGLEDYEFWLSIIELGQGVYCIPEVLVLYRIKSISRNTKFEKRGEVYAETYEYILRKHMKLYTRYWIDVILMLRKENYELGERYNRLINKIPFYTSLKRLNPEKKQKIRRFLGL